MFEFIDFISSIACLAVALLGWNLMNMQFYTLAMFGNKYDDFDKIF
jgi:hypothetical protein